jgi:hypothetical protein
MRTGWIFKRFRSELVVGDGCDLILDIYNKSAILLMMKPHPILATVINSSDRTFARTRNGEIWALPETAKVEAGDTILIKIHDRQDQFCSFVTKLAE